jgi:hypothetical protein
MVYMGYNGAFVTVHPPPFSYNAAATTAILLLAVLLTWNPKSIYKKNGPYIFLN